MRLSSFGGVTSGLRLSIVGCGLTDMFSIAMVNACAVAVLVVGVSDMVEEGLIPCDIFYMLAPSDRSHSDEQGMKEFTVKSTLCVRLCKDVYVFFLEKTSWMVARGR